MKQPAPIGTMTIRTLRKRGGVQRRWIKVGQPNKWRLNAHVVWEKHNGRPVPPNTPVHHKDEDKLNDAPENLELLTKSAHLAAHMPAYRHRCIASLVEARMRRRWTTKSRTKHTGRPFTCDRMALATAIGEVRLGKSAADMARQYRVPRTTLYRLTRGMR